MVADARPGQCAEVPESVEVTPEGWKVEEKEKFWLVSSSELLRAVGTPWTAAVATSQRTYMRNQTKSVRYRKEDLKRKEDSGTYCIGNPTKWVTGDHLSALPPLCVAKDFTSYCGEV